MAYMSPPSLEHIHVPGIREGVCSLPVDPWERVPCPTWSKSANRTMAEKPENLKHFASLRRTRIGSESATLKIWYPMMKNEKRKKSIFSTPDIFFLSQQFFQPIWPRRAQEVNGWHCWTRHCYRTAVGIHGFVQLDDMSKWRAREIFENCYYF